MAESNRFGAESGRNSNHTSADAAAELTGHYKQALEFAEAEIVALKRELQLVQGELEKKKTQWALDSHNSSAMLGFSDVALVLLDSAMRIVRFTHRAGDLFSLLPTDIGRPFGDLLPRFKDRTLLDECKLVLETGRSSEKEVWIEADLAGGASDGVFPPGSVHGPSPLCLLRRIRACQLPAEGRGLVIIMVDITDRIRSEADMRRLVTSLRESSDAMLVFDVDGRITAWNRGAEQMYGYLESEALNMQLRDIVPASFRANSMDRIRSLLGRDRIDSFEAQRLTKDGRVIDVWINATWLTDERGKRIAIATNERDITDRKRHLQTLKSLTGILEDQVASRTEALREKENRLRAIVNSVADAIITIGPAGSIDSFNRSAERIFGYTAREIIGQKVETLLAPAFRHNDELLGFLQSGDSRTHGSLFEAVGRRKDGSTLPIELAVGELLKDQRPGDHDKGRPGSTKPARTSIILIRDVTERVELRRQILDATEQEQRRIGQDLHDSTQQELYGLGMIAENLSESIATEGSPHAKIAARVSEGIGVAAENVRRLARGLIPAEIGAHGLPTALSELAHRTAEMSGIVCRIDCDDAAEPTDPTVATHLYRIAQEAITNVLKHAGAKHIWISLETEGGALTLTICDDGSGLDIPQDVKGIGLKAMYYRAALIGGSLRIQPAIDGGTEVVCTVPVE